MSYPTGPIPLTPGERRRAEMVEGFRAAINRSTGENGSDTPDYILAEYLMGCLEAYNHAVTERAAFGLAPQTLESARRRGRDSASESPLRTL